MTKVSVIVPIYKAEAYLHCCLDSILAQTLTDFELLLIDDGSPDRSGEICDEYAAKDSRVKVIHQENSGVANARQVGMEKAQGDYTIHCDPDDWVEPNMLEELYNEVIKTDADVVICDYWINSERIVKQEPSSLDHLTILSELFQQLHGSCCNKLLKRSCYKKHKISFPLNVSYCEDLSFWIRLFKYPVKISYLPKAFYHYMQHQDSIVHNYMNKPDDDGWKLIQLLRVELKTFPQIKKIGCLRTAYTVVNDAYKYGDFNSWTFFKRHAKYIPYIMQYSKIGIRARFFYIRCCLGFYSYYKRKQN